jgi:hypothetical protein
MQTLSYGYKLPESGDTGAPLFTALEDNIERLNDHTHNGTDSAPLTATSIVGVPATIPFGSWVTYGGPVGFYRQQVTLPAGFNYNTVQMSFRLASTGDYVFPRVDKISNTQYYVYTIDSTESYTVVYGG